MPLRLGPLSPLGRHHHVDVSVPGQSLGPTVRENRLHHDQPASRSRCDGLADIPEDLDRLLILPVVQAPFHGVYLTPGDGDEEVPGNEVLGRYLVSDVAVPAALGVEERPRVLDDFREVVYTAAHILVPAKNGRDEAAAPAADIHDNGVGIAGDVRPGVILQYPGGHGRGTGAQRSVQDVHPTLLFEVLKHVRVGVVVDLRCRPRGLALNRLWNASRHIVELIAVQFHPVAPAGPVVGAQQRRGLVVAIEAGLFVVLEYPVIVEYA